MPYSDHDILMEALRTGLTTDEIRAAIQEGMAAGRIRNTSVNESNQQQQARYQEVQEYLQDRYLAGYQDYLGNITQQNVARAEQHRRAGTLDQFQEEAPMAPWQWRQMPSHSRARLMTQVHEELATRGDYNRIDMPGYVQRGGSKHLFPQSAITNASFLGVTPEGETLTTWDVNKAHKRMQMLGAHEQIGLSNVPTTRGAVRAGPQSVGQDDFSIVRSALVIGGEPGPSGQGYIDPSVGRATSRQVMDVYNQPGRGQFSGVPERGTRWGAGEDIVLANELSAFSNRSWDYTLMDYATISRQKLVAGQLVEEQGYRFVLGREADLSTGRTRIKAYGTKAEAVPMDLSNITDVATGNQLGIQFMSGIKDVQGAVYSHYQARDPQYLAQQIGMSVEDVMATSYSELGAAPMQAMEGLVNAAQGSLIRTINVPRIVHESALERYAPVTVGQPQALPGQPGMYSINTQYQAFVDDMAVSASRDYDVKSPFLNRTELENLRRQQPSTYGRIMQYAEPIREAYGSVVSAALAGTGDYALPQGTASLRTSQMQAFYTQALEQARGRLGIEDLSMVPKHDVGKELLDILGQSSLRDNPLMFQGGGGLVSPSPKHLQRFRAQGKFIDQEVAPMFGALTGMFAEAGTAGFEKAAAKFQTELESLAGSPQTFRQMTGAQVPHKMMKGDVIRGSDALADWEVYVPGLEEGRYSFVRFPTQGEESWDPRLSAVGISRAEAIRRNLDPDSMYASTTIMQAVAGDNDGDLAYALKIGAVEQKADGGIYDKATGDRLDTAGHWQAAADRAVNVGAAKLIEEYVGMGQPAPTLEQAREWFVNQALHPQKISAADLDSKIQEGMRMVGDIGQYYNTFVRGMANVDPGDVQGRGAMQQLWNLSHGRAQRPAALTPGMQEIQDLMSYNPMTGGVYERAAGKPGKVSGGAAGLLREATRSILADAIDPDTGELRISPETFAGAMAPFGRRKEVAAAYEEYLTNPRGTHAERMARLQTTIGAAVGSEERWLTSSPIGMLLGGQAVNRAKGTYKGADVDYPEIARQLGVSESAVYGLETAWRRGQQDININRKVRKGMEDVAATVEDLRSRDVNITGGLPQRIDAPPAAAGGGQGGPPPPPTTTAAPMPEPEDSMGRQWEFMGMASGTHPRYGRPEFGSQEWFDAIPEIAYGSEQAVPFSRDDLSPAEKAKARETAVRIKGDQGRQQRADLYANQGVGGDIFGSLQSLGMAEGDAWRVMVKRAGNRVTISELGDNLPQAMSQLDVYSYAAETAFSGGAIASDPAMLERMQRAGFSARDVETLESLSQSARSGTIDPRSSRAVAFKQQELYQTASKAGAMGNALAPYDVGGAMTGMAAGAAFRQDPHNALNQLRAMDAGKAQFGDLGDNLTAFNKAVRDNTEAFDKVKKAMGKLPENTEDLVGELQALKRRMGFEESAFGKAEAKLRGQVKQIRDTGTAAEYPELQAAERALAGEAGRKRRTDEFETALERQIFEASEGLDATARRRAGGFRQVGKIFGLSMLPWQLQFAQQWGTAQSQEAFQYAAGVDVQMGQAMAAAGAVPPAGLGMQQQEFVAQQSWAQYYRGQGAAQGIGFGDPSGFLAQHPGMARGLGAVGNYGQFMGYYLAGELAANQVFGRGMFVGADPLFRPRMTGAGGILPANAGQAARLVGGMGAVAGVGVLGLNAAVDIANAAQDRTRTIPEAIQELGQTGGRALGGFQAWAAGGIEDAARWAGIRPLEGAAQALQRGIAQNEALTEPTDALLRDQARWASPVYKRQQAILAAMKEQGIAPDQASQYSLVYSQMGVLDPQQQARMAARDFQLEQQTGLTIGQIAQTGMGITTQMGYVPGAAQGMQQQFYEMTRGYAQNQPQQYQALSAGLTAAAGIVGEWPARLGMDQDWAVQAASRLGEGLAGGMTMWEANRQMQRMTLSTPYAFSRGMEGAGFGDLAVVDELGRPANYQEQRALTLAEREWGPRRQRFQLAQQGEQIAMQRDWMTQGWELQDTMVGIQNRRRVEDADMSILSLENRLTTARENMATRQRQQELQRTQMGWQREDIERAGVRAGIQWQWQQQDFRENRQQFGTELGWQMEDFEEAIRFSSGRQRRRLIEQRERAVVRAGWQRRDMAQAESRAEIKYGWGQEDRERSLERLEEESELREEMMEKDNAAQERNIAFMEKQLDLLKERRTEMVDTIIPTEEKQRDLQREQQEQGLIWREERLALDTEYFETIQPLQEALNVATDKMNEGWTMWNLLMNEGVPAAAEAFLKAFGKDSDAFRAIEAWLEKLESFEMLGEGGNALGAAVDQRISEFMEQQFPTYTLR